MRHLKKFTGLIVVALLSIVVLAGCDTGKPSNRAASVSTREAVYAQAANVAPVPHPANFPIRKALVKYTERQDLINHPWYIYIMGMNGEPVGYFVGQTYPVNACDFLSSTENIVFDDHGNIITTAPSLDGIFYGGSGASGGCGTMFFFDAATDAMQTFNAPFWYASDQPLNLDAPRLNSVAATPVS